MRDQFSILFAETFTAQSLQIDYQKNTWSAHYAATERCEIEKKWLQRLASAKADARTLYDSELFRLHSFCGNQQSLSIRIGKTSYKEYVATRQPSENLARANPIGTAIIPISADGYVPIGHRSKAAEVNPGKFFTFGGFFDRRADRDARSDAPNLFACAVREVYEELGLELATKQLTGLGIVYDLLSCHPEITFGCELLLTRAELARLDWTSELGDLSFIPVRKLDAFVSRYYADFTNTLIGGLSLFKRWRASCEGATATEPSALPSAATWIEP